MAVIVRKDDGKHVRINLIEHTGFLQDDGFFRVNFKDGTSGIVVDNPVTEDGSVCDRCGYVDGTYEQCICYAR